MFSIRLVSALAAAALLSMASADDTSSSSKIVSIPTPTKTVAASAMQTIGCFETGVPLEDHGKGNFVTAGSCQQICLGLEKNVLGLSEGDHCWCGDEYPPKNSQVDNSTCSGGHNLLWVMSTGNSRNEIQYYKPESSSSSSSSTTSSKTAAATSSTAAETGSVSNPTPEPEKKGPNTVGIAVGVVVGVLVLAAIIGGVFLYLRRQRRQAVEDEYRRQAAVNSFVSGGKLHTSNSSMTDSRLDPEFMARRQSNGSIADNEDYSRRILKVTNA
ncbi:Protein SLG1 [Kalmusia sp. IMI 367209]|nr:Protein SLG1 [Kalmusia sp. IMI 367209]